MLSARASFVAVLLLTSTAAVAVDIDDLNVALQKRGAPWTARESDITRLSDDEKSALGGILDLPPARPARALADPVGLPSRLDWRDNDGNFVTSIKDQGGCGSCWAFAAVAVAESALLIEANTPGVDLDLSEQFVLSCSGAGTCVGGVAEVAAETMSTYGARTETCFPYSFHDESCLHSCTDDEAVVRLRSTTRLPYDDGALKVALQQSPVTACFTIYDDFYSYGGGIYDPISTTITGAHAVELIGYDDSEGAWIAKNQWGTSWGEQGFFRIKYGAAEFGWCGLAYEKNRGPTFDLPTSIALAGDEPIAIPLNAKDPDAGDVLTYSVDGLPGATVDDDGVLRLAPGALRGVFRVTVTATDDWIRPASTSNSFELSICDTACDDGNPCTRETCPTGACEHTDNDNASCDDDGNACTDERCVAGACHAAVADDTACDDDNNACTRDVCEDGACQHVPVAVDSRCDDGRNDCFEAFCDQAGDCVGSAVNDGGACDDQVGCTENDACSNGRCVGAVPAACDDGIACTEDRCDDEKAPQFEPNDTTPYLDLFAREVPPTDLRLDGDDVSTGAIPIGFAWAPTAAGGAPVTPVSSMYVSTNGLVSFSGPDVRFAPSCLPDGSGHLFAAALWSDWRCDRNDGCRVVTALVDDEALGTARVVQWHGLRSVLDKRSRVDFELLLLASGGWQVRVDRLIGEQIHNATIGVNFAAGDAMVFTCGMVVLQAGMRAVPRIGGPTYACQSSTSFDSCLADDQCVPAGTPHPDNACLVCNSVGYEPSRADCDDGQRCSTDDRCDSGVCIGTPPRACDDGLDCTIDGCGDITVNGQLAAQCTHAPRAGSCVIDDACYADGDAHPTDPCLACDARADGTGWSARAFVACDDGNACTLEDTCVAGACVGTDVCGTGGEGEGEPVGEGEGEGEPVGEGEGEGEGEGPLDDVGLGGGGCGAAPSGPSLGLVFVGLALLRRRRR